MIGVAGLFSLVRWPFLLAVWLLVLAGFGWGHWDHALTLRGARPLGWVLAGWSFLHIGTMWLNARLDEDQGPVVWGTPAHRVPAYVTGCAYGCLAACVVCLAQVAPEVRWASVAAVVLAVGYSHPKTRWKGHAVFGPLTNVLGYGFLSPFAGWWIVGAPFDARTGVVVGGAMWGVLGVYYLAQFFQEEDDARRGYQTRVVTHGPGATLATARVALRVAWGIGLGLAIAGWLPRPLLCVAPVVWLHDRAMTPGGEMAGDEGAQRAEKLILQLGGLLALCLLIATVVYLWDSFHGEWVAGQATRSGHPR